MVGGVLYFLLIIVLILFCLCLYFYNCYKQALIACYEQFKEYKNVDIQAQWFIDIVSIFYKTPPYSLNPDFLLLIRQKNIMHM